MLVGRLLSINNDQARMIETKVAASDQLGSCFNNLGRRWGWFGLRAVVEKMERDACILHSCYAFFSVLHGPL